MVSPVRNIMIVSVMAACYLSACSKTPTDLPAQEAPEKTVDASKKMHHEDMGDQNTDSHEHHSHHDSHSHGHDHGGLHLSQARVKPSVPGQKVSSAYFTLENHTDKDIKISGISSDVAAKTEFHTMSMKGSKMLMRPLEKVVVPAGGSLGLSEGGDHVMLMQLNQPIKAGDKVNFSLTLNNGETLAITAPAVESTKEVDHQHMNHDMSAHATHKGH